MELTRIEPEVGIKPMKLLIARWSSLLAVLAVGVFFAGPALAAYYIDMADSADLGYVPDGGQIQWVHSF